MTKTLAIVFGLVFLVVGILGFVPAATQDVNGMPMLLGIFHVNFAHNLVHVASGVVFLLCGMAGAGASRTFFRIFGAIYALVAILGFMNPAGPLLGMISNNPADTYLHVALALVMLIIGFAPMGGSSTTSQV
ncbi:MAG: hypothetical protein QOI04_224 [Verrucomicrobiota bacterium]